MQKKYAYALLAGVAITVILASNYVYNNRPGREFQTRAHFGTWEANLRHSERLPPTAADASGHTKARSFPLQDLAELEGRFGGPDGSHRRLSASMARRQSGLALRAHH